MAAMGSVCPHRWEGIYIIFLSCSVEPSSETQNAVLGNILFSGCLLSWNQTQPPTLAMFWVSCDFAGSSFAGYYQCAASSLSLQCQNQEVRLQTWGSSSRNRAWGSATKRSPCIYNNYCRQLGGWGTAAFQPWCLWKVDLLPSWLEVYPQARLSSPVCLAGGIPWVIWRPHTALAWPSPQLGCALLPLAAFLWCWDVGLPSSSPLALSLGFH